MLAAALRQLRLFFQTDGGFNLTLMGLLVLFLGLLYSTLRLARHDAHAGVISVLLALISASSLALASLGASLDGQVDAHILTLILVAGAGSFLVGLVMVLRERRFGSFKPERSFGLLYAGVGLFIFVSAILLPTIPVQLHTPPTAVITATTTPSRTTPPTRTLVSTLTATPIPSLTTTPTPLPTLTATPTRAPLLLPTRKQLPLTLTATTSTMRTPEADTDATTCMVAVLQNVNLRAAPSISADRLTTIPYQVILTVIGKSADNEWWNVQYENQRGWVNAEFVQPESSRDCADVPVVQP